MLHEESPLSASSFMDDLQQQSLPEADGYPENKGQAGNSASLFLVGKIRTRMSGRRPSMYPGTQMLSLVTNGEVGTVRSLSGPGWLSYELGVSCPPSLCGCPNPKVGSWNRDQVCMNQAVY